MGRPCDSATRRSLSALSTTLITVRRKTSLLAKVREAPNRSTSTPGWRCASGSTEEREEEEEKKKHVEAKESGTRRWLLRAAGRGWEK